jgi:hypothetical protein
VLPGVAVTRIPVLEHRRDLGPFPKTAFEHTPTARARKENSKTQIFSRIYLFLPGGMNFCVAREAAPR